jgi:hypothetical protein
MSIGTTYKTGEISPARAFFDFAKYTDGTTLPAPTSEERRIPMDKGEEFPPIRSCNKGAWWKLSNYR